MVCVYPSCADFKERVLYRFFGGYKEVVRPDPIPNSAVKRLIADGSASIGCARVGCRRLFLEPVPMTGSFFFHPIFRLKVQRRFEGKLNPVSKVTPCETRRVYEIMRVDSVIGSGVYLYFDNLIVSSSEYLGRYLAGAYLAMRFEMQREAQTGSTLT